VNAAKRHEYSAGAADCSSKLVQHQCGQGGGLEVGGEVRLGRVRGQWVGVAVGRAIGRWGGGAGGGLKVGGEEWLGEG